MSKPPAALAAAFIDRVRSVVGDAPSIGLHEPEIDETDKALVAECLDSTFVSSVGPFVTRFEQEIAAFTGAAHAVAVSNGTSALHLALVLAGVQPGDEVLVPALSFVATANAVSHAGARPHFVDSDPVTMGLDVGALATVIAGFERTPAGLRNPATGARVSAIVPMHTFGHPVDLVALVALADEHGLVVVEDAAESLGSFVGAQHTGTFGRLGILSFNGNKIVTTGGGGMILTDDAELARRAKHLTTTAKVPHEWEFEHDEVAWNYRMPNLNAALGVAQLAKIDRFLAQKRVLADRYAAAFADLDGMSVKLEPPGTTSNYWLVAISLDDPDIVVRDQILRASNDAGLHCRPFWNLLSDQRMYRDAQHGELVVARSLMDSVINVPSSPRLATAR
ncbi:MAG: LegC family aminotransferase [Pseudolysinimonas sp.]